MATRYWVGGAGTWNTSSTTNWSTSSGGASGASAPTITDDVVIDSSSGTGTITCTSATCANLTVTASQAIILGAASSTLAVYGNISFPSGGSFSASTNSLTITISSSAASKTITSNGKSFYNLTLNDATGTCSLSDGLTVNNTFTINQGTFSTNNFTIYAGSFYYQNTGFTTINLGSSVFNINGASSGGVVFNGSSLLTFNYGTSHFKFYSPTSTLSTSVYNVSFYDVSFFSVTTVSITVQNASSTFNSLTFGGLASAVANYTISGNLKVNGTFSTYNTTPSGRVRLKSGTTGTAVTVTAAAVSLSDADFSDITAAGTAAPFSGTRLGNCQEIGRAHV